MSYLGTLTGLSRKTAAAVLAHAEAAHAASRRAGGAGAPVGASDLLAALPRAISALRAA